MPDALRGHEINWQFESPLQEANSRAKSLAFRETAELMAIAAQMDPGTRFDVDIDKAFRQALGGVAPADWEVPKEIADNAKAQQAQIDRAAQAAQAMSMGADVATKVGGAVQTMGDAAQSVQAAQGVAA